MIKLHMFTFSPIQENTYLLWNEKGETIIIDPGCYFTAEQETLQQFIENNGLKPVQLINTHCHLDHIFGNKWVAKKWGLELYIHPDEERMLQLAPASGLMYGLTVDNYKGPLHFLKDNDVLKLGDDELKIILVPGHSPGHICLYSEAQNFLIGGDVLFLESIGRTDLPGGNYEQLLQNIRERLYVLPGTTIVYPGHGPHTTIAHEQKFNPYTNAGY